MRELHRRLPSVTALVAFEAAGRHRNFSRAAEELHVSQAAVSRQIRKLEDRLGLELFERLHRSVALTPAGERLHQAVGFGFDHIADAVTHIQQMNDDRHVGVAANNAVAFYWLRPRVTAFQQEHPEIRLAVFAHDADPALDGEDIDIAIRYGDGHWPDADAAILFEEALFPVCSPAYAREHPLERPEHLLDSALLYMEPQGPDWVTWSEWLRASGVDPGNRLPPGVMFNSYPVLLQAAVEGQGVAMGTDHLVDNLLEEGTLVRPLAGDDYRTGRGYYLALPAGSEPSADTLAFRDWLRRRVRTDE